jgi:hypothetical protein
MPKTKIAEVHSMVLVKYLIANKVLVDYQYQIVFIIKLLLYLLKEDGF